MIAWMKRKRLTEEQRILFDGREDNPVKENGGAEVDIILSRPKCGVDYSQTINQYTEIDVYPLPRIDDMITNLANNRILSTFYLNNAYQHICHSDNKCTGFEENGRLYEFRRIPFGATNGVAVCHSQMDIII